MTTLTRHPMLHDPAYPSCEIQTGEQVALVQMLNDKIRAGQIEMIDQACLCGDADYDLVATYDRYRVWQPIVICRACGLMRCQPRMSNQTLDWFYGSDVYRQLYDNSAILPHTPEKFAEHTAKRAFRFHVIRELIPDRPIAQVAEIGCGAGWNLYGFHHAGIKVAGCDFSPELTAAGRSQGMDIRHGPRSVLEGSRYDLVILSHVLEHLPDPVAEMKAISALLSPHGSLYIEVPHAEAFCQGALQSAHLFYFTPSHLIDAAAKAGLAPAGERQLGPHFSILFRPQEGSATRPTANEYARLRGIIRAHERRERAKDILKKLGLFDPIRKLVGRLR